MNRLRHRLLELIKAKDGQLSWYQLDRTISSEGVERDEPLVKSLTGLEADGFIVSHVGANPAQPTYSVTLEGSRLVDAVK